MTGDHRVNLLEVIVGEIGVKLMRAIKGLTEASARKSFEIREVKKAIGLYLQNYMTIEDFLDLDNIFNINSEITKKKIELNVSKNSNQIIARPELEHVLMPTLPNGFHTVIAKTLDDISTDAETRLKKQLDRHGMHTGGEKWIRKGLDWIYDDHCPFCGQDIKGLLLVSFYRQFFSESYCELIEEIRNLEQKITNEMGDETLGNLGIVIANNKTALQFWKQTVSAELTEIDYEMLISEPTKALRKEALSLVKNKHKSPLTEVPPSDKFQTAALKHGEVTADIKTYNDQVVNVNVAIKVQKEQTKTINSAATEAEIARLELIKLRYTSKVNQLCLKLKKLQFKKSSLDEKKEAAKETLDKHGVTEISTYQKAINKYLKEFDASFSITNTKKGYGKNAPSVSYQIQLNGHSHEHSVDIGSGSTPLGKPCFRTALSAGDRSTLALAFFLAQLHHNPKKKDCVVVFDDPVSSLDHSRRERTAEFLAECGEESAQLLVLSHDPHFLHLVRSKLPPKADPHFLQLSRAPDNTTVIEEWDIEREIQGRYFKDHAILKSYLENGAMGRELSDIAGKIRLVLEGYLRYQFPHKFEHNVTLGLMIGEIKGFSEKPSIHLKLEELTKLNKFSRRFHHPDSEKTSGERLTDSELQGHVRRALAITYS